ncbi:MAG: sulfocyanin-like copper-binding protein [Caldilineaceae bacterium]
MRRAGVRFVQQQIAQLQDSPLQLVRFISWACRHRCRYVLIVCFVGVAVACSGSNQSPAAANAFADVTVLDVVIHDSYYGDTDTNLTNPPTWTVNAGGDVVVNIVNQGELKHNWAIVKPGITVPVPYEEGQAGDIILHGIGMVYSNSQTTTTFRAPEPGAYQVICTVSGHYPTMQGRLIVK